MNWLAIGLDTVSICKYILYHTFFILIPGITFAVLVNNELKSKSLVIILGIVLGFILEYLFYYIINYLKINDYFYGYAIVSALLFLRIAYSRRHAFANLFFQSPASQESRFTIVIIISVIFFSFFILFLKNISQSSYNKDYYKADKANHSEDLFNWLALNAEYNNHHKPGNPFIFNEKSFRGNYLFHYHHCAINKITGIPLETILFKFRSILLSHILIFVLILITYYFSQSKLSAVLAGFFLVISTSFTLPYLIKFFDYQSQILCLYEKYSFLDLLILVYAITIYLYLTFSRISIITLIILSIGLFTINIMTLPCIFAGIIAILIYDLIKNKTFDINGMKKYLNIIIMLIITVIVFKLAVSGNYDKMILIEPFYFVKTNFLNYLKVIFRYFEIHNLFSYAHNTELIKNFKIFCIIAIGFPIFILSFIYQYNIFFWGLLQGKKEKIEIFIFVIFLTALAGFFSLGSLGNVEVSFLTDTFPVICVLTAIGAGRLAFNVEIGKIHLKRFHKILFILAVAAMTLSVCADAYNAFIKSKKTEKDNKGFSTQIYKALIFLKDNSGIQDLCVVNNFPENNEFPVERIIDRHKEVYKFYKNLYYTRAFHYSAFSERRFLWIANFSAKAIGMMYENREEHPYPDIMKDMISLYTTQDKDKINLIIGRYKIKYILIDKFRNVGGKFQTFPPDIISKIYSSEYMDIYKVKLKIRD